MKLSAIILVIVSTALSGAESASTSPQYPNIHRYFIAADEVMWNYAPVGRNLTGLPGPELEGGSRPLVFRKALYREYTDATFAQLKPRPPEWEHLGLLGPLIRAEVGDTIKVVFKNNTKIFCSMHPHGLSYDKSSEGALYADGESSDREGNGVAPGQVYTYTWTVPERSGPAPGEASSTLWVYHSHFLEPRDINAGLVGPIIITRKGMSGTDGKPKDIDREFIVAFQVFDETQSRYFEANARGQKTYTPGARITDPVFRLSFLFYSLNGLIEGNLPMLKMKSGERIRWYLFANDNEDDVHTPHWHGQTLISNGMRTDMVHLEPMMTSVADMIPDMPGTWLLHCHVNEHLEGGMQALFTVVP